jgi:serine/threonine-protein kinase
MRACPSCHTCFDDHVEFCHADGTRLQTVLEGGRLLDGKYELTRLIGEGGMGAVFEAVQRGIERRVAVKVIRREYVADAAALERFRREALATGRVKHPAAIVVHDFGVTADGTAYLAMEYLAGRSLRDELMHTGPMPANTVAELIGPVAAAVEAAHRQGIVHRDLKPDNVFLETLDDGTRTPKVLDFGIAKLRYDDTGGAHLTREGSSLGTPAYMSPEQARGQVLDARSDIYSLGVIAYEMLAGRLPFSSDSSMGFLVQHAVETPLPLRTANPTVSPAVEAVVMQALAKAPEQRFTSALEFSRALSAATGPASAAPTPAQSGLGEATRLVRRLATALQAGAVTNRGGYIGWAVGAVNGQAREIATVYSELARELVAAAAQRVPYEAVFAGARSYIERTLAGRTLFAPHEQLPAGVGASGLVVYAPQPGLVWSLRGSHGVEQELLLTAADAGGVFLAETTCVGSAELFVRSAGTVVWTGTVAFSPGLTTIVLCVPELGDDAVQNPEMFAHLFGTIEIQCAEPGAEIFVDGGATPWGATNGATPSLLYCVVPGRHRVELGKSYCAPACGEVDVNPGRRSSIVLELARAEVRLGVSINVDGALVELTGPEGQASVRTLQPGLATPVNVTVPAGEYQIKASQPGFVEYVATISLGTDSVHEIVMSRLACPICGEPSAGPTFTCVACARGYIHERHRHASGMCLMCAARGAFDRASRNASIDVWSAYLAEFAEADPALAAQAQAERKRLEEARRESELDERQSYFAELATKGGLAATVQAWRQAVAERPADGEAHFALGMALEAASDASAALGAYRSAVACLGRDPFVHRALGRLLAELRVAEEAVRAYSTAVTLKGDYVRAHIELARLLRSLGQLDSAVEGFKVASALQPSNCELHEELAQALQERGWFREAGDAYTAASRCWRDSGNAEASTAAQRRAQLAYEQTGVGKAARLIKGIFDKE